MTVIVRRFGLEFGCRGVVLDAHGAEVYRTRLYSRFRSLDARADAQAWLEGHAGLTYVLP